MDICIADYCRFTIHVIFASKIIFNVLGILNVNHVGVFVTSYVGVIISVVVIYMP